MSIRHPFPSLGVLSLLVLALPSPLFAATPKITPMGIMLGEWTITAETEQYKKDGTIEKKSHDWAVKLQADGQASGKLAGEVTAWKLKRMSGTEVQLNLTYKGKAKGDVQIEQVLSIKGQLDADLTGISGTFADAKSQGTVTMSKAAASSDPGARMGGNWVGPLERPSGRLRRQEDPRFSLSARGGLKAATGSLSGYTVTGITPSIWIADRRVLICFVDVKGPADEEPDKQKAFRGILAGSFDEEFGILTGSLDIKGVGKAQLALTRGG